MRFRCECGNVTPSAPNNFPYSIYIVADVDIEDYWEAWERGDVASLWGLNEYVESWVVLWQGDAWNWR